MTVSGILASGFGMVFGTTNQDSHSWLRYGGIPTGLGGNRNKQTFNRTSPSPWCARNHRLLNIYIIS